VRAARQRLVLLAVIWSAGACSSESGRPADSDGGVASDAPLSCPSGGGCRDGTFCGAGSRTCVSAVVQVVAGAHHSCALHRNGAVSCWGLAESLYAGGGSVVAPSFQSGLHGARALSAGTHLTCAITAGSGVRCWGNLSMTVLQEDGSPLAEVGQLAVGPQAACAANPRGVYCWGKNPQGQLARPVSLPSSAHALLAQPGKQRLLGAGLSVLAHDGQRLCAWGNNATHVVSESDSVAVYAEPVCSPVPEVDGLLVGADHACVLRPGGTFSCWGERYYGALGLGGGDTDTADVPPFGSTTSLRAPVVDLALGVSHTCALLTEGSVTCFGRNHQGQVGPDPGTAAEEVRTPATVTGFAGPVRALGSGSSAHHTCAILEDGSVQCWGTDAAGQLGDGVTSVQTGRFSPQPVHVRF
jgi:alpha-tubulin suppressor-like RCC1 family protein